MNIDTLLGRVDCHNTTWPGKSDTNAHHAMQVHLDCLVGECPAKTVAYARLHESGRLQPDSGRST